MPGSEFQHHTALLNHFDPIIAKEYGIIEAILIYNFQFWVNRNKDDKKNYIESRTWTYQTIKDIARHYKYLSIKQVERALKRLVDKGVLLKRNFNKVSYDRTCWYAFKNEARFGISYPEGFSQKKEVPIDISRNREIEIPKSGNRNTEIGTPIPDSKTDTVLLCSVKSKNKPQNGTFPFDPKRIPNVIEKQNNNGEPVKVSIEDIVRGLISKKIKVDNKQLEEAWKVLVDYDKPVTDPFQFILGVFKNKKKKSKLEKALRKPSTRRYWEDNMVVKKDDKPEREMCGDYILACVECVISGEIKPTTVMDEVKRRVPEERLKLLLEKQGIDFDDFKQKYLQ